MKKKRRSKKKQTTSKALPIIVTVIAVLSLALYILNATIEKEAIATVNGEPIFLADVEKQYNQIPEQYQELTSKELILNQLIDEKLLMQEAKRQGITVTPTEVDEAMEQAIKSTGLTKKQFEEQLKKNNLTLEEMQEYYKKQITIYQKLPDKLITQQIQITEADMKNFYEREKQLFIEASGKQLSFKEAEETIELYLLGEQQKELFQELLVELRKDADIKMQNLNKITGNAVSDCNFEDVVFYYADWATPSVQMKTLVENYNVQMIEESSSKELKECLNMEDVVPQLICTKNSQVLIGVKGANEIEQFISEC